jgi:hypothetical protein
MFTESEARAIAADWHSGQASDPAYAANLNSEDPAEMLAEARGALEYVKANTPAAKAYALGVEAAKSAASWTVDGNTKTEFIPAVLEMFEAGDPAVFDYLPAYPDLSGQWADEMTPGRLYEETTGRDAHGDATWNQDAYQEALEELCEAFEAGVSETFEAACEAELRRAIA